MNEIYLDNCATTKPCQECVDTILNVLTNKYGNPSSLHEKGFDAEQEIESARNLIAQILNAQPPEIYFTSGGTEANNMAIFGAINLNKKRGNKIVTTTIEHSSVYNSIKELESAGFEVVYLKPDLNGQILAEKFENAIDQNTIFVSAMMVNNETGAILPIDKIKKFIIQKKSPAIFHIDAVQAFGKLNINVEKLGVDLLSISAHKIHGPKGVGALYKRKNVKINPLFFGGEQQKKLRPGTEPVPLIAGFSAAAKQLDLSLQNEKIKFLNKYFIQKINNITGISINSPQNAVPHIINISTNKIKSETMLHFLSSKKIFISSGSACAKGKKSRVLSEMNLPLRQIETALRISFSRYNSTDDIDQFLTWLDFGMKNLAHI